MRDRVSCQEASSRWRDHGLMDQLEVVPPPFGRYCQTVTKTKPSVTSTQRSLLNTSPMNAVDPLFHVSRQCHADYLCLQIPSIPLHITPPASALQPRDPARDLITRFTILLAASPPWRARRSLLPAARTPNPPLPPLLSTRRSATLRVSNHQRSRRHRQLWSGCNPNPSGKPRVRQSARLARLTARQNHTRKHRQPRYSHVRPGCARGYRARHVLRVSWRWSRD
jgi:hypothetical protein